MKFLRFMVFASFLNHNGNGHLALVEVKKEQLVESPNDLIRDPYVFEFLGIPEKNIMKERTWKTN